MIPEGYEKLAVIGIAWKGNYTDGTAYKLMNAVYYEGSTYVALKDDPVTPPAADNTNWTYLAKGFGDQLLSAVTALDTSGVVGTAGEQVGAQVLMDAIADKVMTKLLAKSQIVNNLLATDPTTVLAAPMGKTLSDKDADLQRQVTQLNGDLGSLQTVETVPLKPEHILFPGPMDTSFIAHMGPVKVLKLTTQFTSAIAGGTTFYTMPEGYKPTMVVKFPTITVADASTVINFVVIYPDGRIIMDWDIIPNLWYFIYAVFV